MLLTSGLSPPSLLSIHTGDLESEHAFELASRGQREGERENTRGLLQFSRIGSCFGLPLPHVQYQEASRKLGGAVCQQGPPVAGHLCILGGDQHLELQSLA